VRKIGKRILLRCQVDKMLNNGFFDVKRSRNAEKLRRGVFAVVCSAWLCSLHDMLFLSFK
jgi:hypothetical protein